MARDVDRIDRDPAIIDWKAPTRSPPTWPELRNHQRDRGRAEIAMPFADQGLLQLARLDQVAVERIV